jgi:long-chain acyl-CoA synthetase
MIKEGLAGKEGAVCLNASTPNIFDANGVGEQGARVLGIYMKNCPEWILFEYACYAIRAATVPLYHTLDLPSLKYIVEHTQMTSIVCSLEHGELDNLCQLRSEGAIPALQTVILNIESLSLVPPAVISKAKRCDLRLTCIWDVARVGRAYPARLSTPASTDVATFCYTSGTTGVPKGALITHENILSVANAAISTVFSDLGPTDSYLSFLPLPHIFERMVLTALLASGGAVGFFQGDPLKIVEDTGALQPTIYCAVPRLLNKIYDKIMLATVPPAENGPPESLGAAIKRKMLAAAISTKVAALRADGSCLDHWLWDALLFKKIKTALGMANVRHVVSGGAPLSVSTAEFFKVMLGSSTAVHEGYGLTETTGGLSITETSDKSPSGHVGSVLPCVEVCLADVPSMEYG